MDNSHPDGFLGNVAAGVTSGLILAVAVTMVGRTYADQIEAFFNRSHPTCASPEGLVEVPRTSIRAQGPGNTPEGAVDGYFGSLWLPEAPIDATSPHVPHFSESPAQRTLTLILDSPRKIRLVCVNNALGNSKVNYTNWGKVRTVAISTNTHPRPRTAVLQSMPESNMQAMQEVARDLGRVRRLAIRVDDAYGGITIETFDPDSCGQPSKHVPVDKETAQLRFTRGCLRAAVPQAGLSEVVLYTE